jgi:putative SOS response-associated peptidase YedK
MCGRFTLRTPAREVAEAFGLAELPLFPPRYNIAPTQPLLAVRRMASADGRQATWLKWGLVPSWAQDPSIGSRMINARGETAAEKPSFRTALARRRCLVPADGFYEWRREGKARKPCYVRLADGRPFALAGLWEHWERAGQAIDSCTLLTTEANELMAGVHDRMPVILDPSDYDLWLDPAVQDAARVAPLLRPFPSERMTAYPVSTWVNSPTHEDPQCIEPVG